MIFLAIDCMCLVVDLQLNAEQIIQWFESNWLMWIF